MTKKEEKLALAKMLTKELQRSISKYEDQEKNRDKYFYAQSEASNMDRLRMVLNKVLIDVRENR